MDEMYVLIFERHGDAQTERAMNHLKPMTVVLDDSG